jgi:RHS repeat-associated protein
VKLIWNDAGTTQTLTANSAGESYSRTITIVDNNNIFAGSSSTSEISADDYNVPRSESGCSGTGVYAVLKHDPDYPDFANKGYPFNKSATSDNTGISVTKIGTSEGDRANMSLHWMSNWTGTITVTIYYSWRGRDDAWDHVGDCDAKDFPLVSYTITRCTNPLGSLAGSPLIVSKIIDNTIQLEYQTNFTDIPEVKFFVDAQLVQQGESKTLSYNTSEFKAYTITTSILDKCGTWWPGPSKTVSVQPTCYVNSPSSVRLGLLGFGYDATGYEIRKDVQYTVTNHAITDFPDHYNLVVRDGANDITFNANSFILSKGLGSYRIIAVKKVGRELCPAIPELKIFAGGRDEKIENDCPIFLPEDLTKFNFINPLDPSILEHFAATVISKKAIIIKPGVTLALGAEMILINPEPVPDPLDTDKIINFVQSKSYDEYGALLNESRSYFDTDGKPLQSQSKNFDADVVLASQSVYDAYQRSVLNTLPAPIYVGTKGEAPDECNGTEVIGHDMNFKYKPDFIKASNGDIYSYRNFDLEKQESPEPVLSNEPGTLGWYYSINNGTATGDNVKLNEPLVAVTQYPFSRAIYQPDGSGLVKGVTKPGDAFKPGSGRLAVSSIEKVENEDPYLTPYFNIRASELGFQRPILFEGNFLKKQTTDENGLNSVTYSDIEGHSLLHLYFGKNDNSNVAPLSRSYQFYNDLGQVILTLSPNALQQYNGSNFSAIDKTEYQYNNKGLLVKLIESDGGATEYVYSKGGRLRFSQNAEQEKTGRYSYTHYDRLGRPIESGEVSAGVIPFKSLEMMSIVDNIGDDGFTATGNEFSTRSQTYYDQPAEINLGARKQEFVMGNVSHSKKDENIISYYSYDELGRVKWMVQDIMGLGVKTIDYVYGPTGNVQQITYQKDSHSERFTHFYEYNRNGGLHKLFTTTELLSYDKNGKLTNAGITYNAHGKIENQGVLELQATYFYYLHGSIKRIEYANKLQGIDYVYTVDGALKSINDAVKENDPGGDNNDVFGMTLDYYSGDYLSSGYTPEPITYPSATVDLYNNVIKGTRWHGPIEADNTFAYAYEYDDRYQFKKASWGSTKTGNMLFLPDIYGESIGDLNTNGYDGNGNIQRLTRKNALGNNIAEYAYHYEANSNKLSTISEENKIVRSYKYNAIGQMVSEKIDDTYKYIEYDATGKVQKIYRDDDKTKLLVTFQYDDRGFRLNKTAYNSDGVPEERTWYINDGSGQLVSTYVQSLKDATPPEQTEIPVYGARKIGIFKPKYGFTLYELTDHLGNVRAVLGEQLEVEYVATMESERINKESDKQQGFFKNIVPAPSAEFINHTPSHITDNGQTEVIDNPNEVNRLNNRPNGELNPKPVGAGMMLWVHPGDVIKAEVFVKYADFDSEDKNIVAGLAGFLTTSFGLPPGAPIDMQSIFKVVEEPGFALLPAWSKLQDDQPRAFLNYLLFDNNFELQNFDFDQVTSGAKIPIDGTPHSHEKLMLDIPIQKEGFLYIYVSNESDQNMDVYFDDLRINHTYSDVVGGGDYYPYGLAIEDRQIQREFYRFGYQGQFAEKDDETGWNHFELREYDPVIGRWTATDPKRQFFSPYVGMGNNPINGVDPDGGFIIEVYSNSDTEHKGPVLFTLDDGKTEVTKLTTKQAYKKGWQWTTPTGKNYAALLSVNRSALAVLGTKFFTAQDLANFAKSVVDLSDHWVGSDGDWKASDRGAAGAFVVLVDKKLYWADFIGNVVFGYNMAVHGQTKEYTSKITDRFSDGYYNPFTDDGPGSPDRDAVIRGYLFQQHGRNIHRTVRGASASGFFKN